ncbi:MAG: sugar kinase [Actinomycetota bacterium]|nr:sugar kinase [Actinomycetota bacterium]
MKVITIGDVVTDVAVIMNQGRVKGSDARASITVSSGGSGANTAAWLARLGVESHFVGRVGDDIFGRHQIDELRRAGVIPHVSVDSSQATGAVVLLIDAVGERDMLTDRGANLALHTDDLSESLFEGAAHLHLSGYAFFEPGPRAVAARALSFARAAALTTSVDPASVSGLAEVGPGSFLRWTHGIDLCFPNSSEADLLGAKGTPEANARRLASVYGEVVVKLGPAGALWCKDRRDALHEPGRDAEVVDSTGAGDAFCAGFLAGWLKEESPEASLRAAVALGAGAVRGMGARPHPAAGSGY